MVMLGNRPHFSFGLASDKTKRITFNMKSAIILLFVMALVKAGSFHSGCRLGQTPGPLPECCDTELAFPKNCKYECAHGLGDTCKSRGQDPCGKGLKCLHKGCDVLVWHSRLTLTFRALRYAGECVSNVPDNAVVGKDYSHGMGVAVPKCSDAAR